MEEILHHLECINLVSNGLNYLSTGAGFLPSTVLRYRSHHKLSRTRNDRWGFECRQNWHGNSPKTGCAPYSVDMRNQNYPLKSACRGGRSWFLAQASLYTDICVYKVEFLLTRILTPKGKKQLSTFHWVLQWFSPVCFGTLSTTSGRNFWVGTFWTRRKDPATVRWFQNRSELISQNIFPLMLQSLLQLVLEWVLGAFSQGILSIRVQVDVDTTYK